MLYANIFTQKKHLIIIGFVCLMVIIGVLSSINPFAILIAAIAVFFLALLIWKFELVLMFTIFIYPLIPQYFGFDLKGMIVVNPHRILLTGLFLVWIIRKAIAGEKIFQKTPLDLAIIIFLFIRFISVIFSIDIKTTFFRYFSELLTYFLFYYLIIDIVRTKKQVKKYISVLIMSGVLVSTLGIFEFFTNANLYSFITPAREDYHLVASVFLSRTGFLRIEGAMSHPIILGMYLILLIPICMIYALSNKSIKKIPWIFILILMSLALFFTFSRSAWVAFLVVMILYALRYPHKLLPVIPLVLLLILQPFFFQTSLSKMENILDESVSAKQTTEISSSTKSRIDQLKVGIPVVMTRPLSGFGIGKSRDAADLKTIDNYYLTLLLESGVLSLPAFLFIYLLFFIKMKNVERISKDLETKNLAYSISISFLGFAIILFMVSLPIIFFIWWVLIALGMRLAMNALNSSKEMD